MSDFVQLLDDINRAGWDYESEWVGNGAVFKVRQGRRDKWQTFVGANPSEAARQAWDAIKPADQPSLFDMGGAA